MQTIGSGSRGLFLFVAIASFIGAANHLPASNFSVPLNANSAIWAIALEPDSRILIGGLFLNSVSGQTCENLARLNSDGSFDPMFRPKGASDVTCLAVQSDGKILVGGYVTNLAGQVCTNLARLNPDGSGDGSFRSPNPNDVVWAICLQPDGKILLAGGFTNLSGNARQYIGRINSDGSLDETFKVATDGQPAGLILQRDGKILVGGQFTSLDGYPRNGLGRLNADGTLDLSFIPAVGGIPWAMALQNDGKLLVTFDSAVSIESNIVRLEADGSLDTNFNATVPDHVNSFIIQNDAKLLTLGTKLLRLGPDGSADDAFAPATNLAGLSLALQSDGELVFASRSVQGRTNTESSLSLLSYQNGTATWTLGATSPNVPWAAFDFTTNGTDWTYLGEGIQTPAGWQFSGAGLPGAGTLRARGGVSGGYFNGSFWFLQSYFGPPVITQQPGDLTNYAGTFAQLRIVAGGSEPLVYQWFKDGSVLQATNSVLTFLELSAADAGSYSVVASNRFGSVQSTLAVLAVLPLPRIATGDGRFGFTNGRFGFSISGEPGQVVVVERTGNLLNWVPVQTNVLGNVPLPFIEPYSNNYPRQFFRVRLLQ